MKWWLQFHYSYSNKNKDVDGKETSDPDELAGAEKKWRDEKRDVY